MAAEIGRRWTAEGVAVRLIDLCLSDPRLEKTLGLKAGEGASDAILFGASLGRVMRAASGFQFVSAGTPVVAAGQVLRSDGMTHLARRLLERQGVSLLYVALGSEGGDAILQQADQVVLLAEAQHGAEEALGTAAVKTVAVVGPPHGEEDGFTERLWEDGHLPSAPPLAGSDALRNAEPDPFDVPIEVPIAAGPSARALAASGRHQPVVEEVLLPAPPPPSTSRRGPLAVVALLLILVLLAVAIQMGWIGAPGAFRAG